jgi:DNA-binding protein Fis
MRLLPDRASSLRTFVAADDRRALAQHLATARSTDEHTCDLRLARIDGVSLPARLWMRVSSRRVKAAEMFGISRKSLWEKLRMYDLEEAVRKPAA